MAVGDPLGQGPVQVVLNATAAKLLIRLAEGMGESDPSVVVRRALGLLEMANHARRQGGRVLFENARGELSEVAF
jgi:hypothetical protein